jgi:hypothetical protein
MSGILVNYAFVPILITMGSYYSNQRWSTTVPNGGHNDSHCLKNVVLLQVNRNLLQFSGVVIVPSQSTVFQGVLWVLVSLCLIGLIMTIQFILILWSHSLPSLCNLHDILMFICRHLFKH